MMNIVEYLRLKWSKMKGLAKIEEYLSVKPLHHVCYKPIQSIHQDQLLWTWQYPLTNTSERLDVLLYIIQQFILEHHPYKKPNQLIYVRLYTSLLNSMKV